MEVINLLVAFCSTQLYTAHATAYPGAHPFTEVLMKPPFDGCVLPPKLCGKRATVQRAAVELALG